MGSTWSGWEVQEMFDIFLSVDLTGAVLNRTGRSSAGWRPPRNRLKDHDAHARSRSKCQKTVLVRPSPSSRYSTLHGRLPLRSSDDGVTLVDSKRTESAGLGTNVSLFITQDLAMAPSLPPGPASQSHVK